MDSGESSQNIFPKCSLTDDEIEIKTNKIQSPIAELVITSSNSIKDAFKSQELLSAKISELEVCLKEVDNLKKGTNYKNEISQIQSMRNRVQNIHKRLGILQVRFAKIEQMIQKE